MNADEIKNLINSKREGAYWDFKEKPHDNKARLLHDIICMANSLCKKDKYIIFGVNDPNKNCEIIGVQDLANRKKQIDYINFIREQNFAGDIRPEVELHSIQIGSKLVECLKIFDKPEKPYYLSKDYKCRGNGTNSKNVTVKANSIYTRNIDTNTPIDSSSDLIKIERMWRERFGLDIAPSERMIQLLLDFNNWEQNDSNHEWAYHKIHSEYQIKYNGTNNNDQLYKYFYINNSSYLGTVSFFYHSTELFSLLYALVDETRIRIPNPLTASISIEHRIQLKYYYYDLSNKNGAFLTYLQKGRYDFESISANSTFIIFKNNQSKLTFDKYLKDNHHQLKDIETPDNAKHVESLASKNNNGFNLNLSEMMKVKILYDNFRLNN
jgi:hypothetical protein